jgi:hypothetical protein
MSPLVLRGHNTSSGCVFWLCACASVCFEFWGLFFTVCCRSQKELVCMQRAGGEKGR